MKRLMTVQVVSAAAIVWQLGVPMADAQTPAGSLRQLGPDSGMTPTHGTARNDQVPFVDVVAPAPGARMTFRLPPRSYTVAHMAVAS